jgi:SAM-dependent methyltransferase
MTEPDLAWIEKLLQSGRLCGPVLELGAGWGGMTCRELMLHYGLKYFGTDLKVGDGADFAADFETGDGIAEIERSAGSLFGTTLVLNVLEHTFNPLAVLDNAVRLTRPGGAVVVIAPAVWQLHGYPIDCCRLLPDWYRRFAATRSALLAEEVFEWIGVGRISDFKDRTGREVMPPPAQTNKAWRLWSRVIHRTFGTYGRGMAFPSHVAIGAVMTRSPERNDRTAEIA